MRALSRPFAACVRSQPCRYYASKPSADPTGTLPDLSHPKWRFREKLNPINFANKGKSGFRQKQHRQTSPSEGPLGPTPSKRERREAMARQRPEERLPALKTDTTKGPPADDPMYKRLYESIKQPIPMPRRKLPGPVSAAQTLESIYLPSEHDLARNQSEIGVGGLALKRLPAPKAVTSDEGSLSFSKALAFPLALPKAEVTAATQVAQAQSPLNAFIAESVSGDEDAFTAIPHDSLTRLIQVHAKLGQVQEARDAFQLIRAHGMQPTVKDYNMLMHAYTSAQDLSGALDIFQTIIKEGVSPNAHSYGILMNSMVVHRRITDAFRLFEDLKKRQIALTQPIVTTLLKGCSMVGDYNRAWRLFEYMRNEVCPPDQLSFNHMIHVCAKTGHTERALVLYHDLLRSPAPDGHGQLQPTESTYNVLLHACAKRPEFYHQTFTLVQRMEASGYTLDRVGYNYLLMACKNQGDIHRAKGLWDVMTSQETAVDLAPNEGTYFNMLECYARVPALVDRIWRQTVWKAKMEEWDREHLEAKMGLANIERLNQDGLKPVDINEWMLDETYNAQQQVDTHHTPDQDRVKDLREYVLQGHSEDDFLLQNKSEALTFFDNLQSSIATGSSPLKMTTGLLNAYIDVLGSYQMKTEMYNAFDKLYAKYQLPYDSQTYVNMLRWTFHSHPTYAEQQSQLDTGSRSSPKHSVSQFPELAEGWRVYEHYEKFRTQQAFPDRWQDLETKFIRNKWQSQGVTHEHRKLEYLLYKHLIQGLTRHDELKRAAFLLSILIQRGHARITNAVHLAPDLYSPSLQAVQKKFPVNAETTAIDTVADCMDSHAAETLSELTLASRVRDQKRVKSTLPHYAQALAQFRASDFSQLVQRATDLGRTELREHVERMLNAAQRGVDRKEDEALKRLRQVKRPVLR